MELFYHEHYFELRRHISRIPGCLIVSSPHGFKSSADLACVDGSHAWGLENPHVMLWGFHTRNNSITAHVVYVYTRLTVRIILSII